MVFIGNVYFTEVAFSHKKVDKTFVTRIFNTLVLVKRHNFDL